MRINEIVLEKSGAFQQGYDTVDRLLSPTRWNEPSGSAAQSKTPAKIDPLDLRDAVASVANNKRFYEKERQILIKVASEIKSGQRKTGQDPQQLSAILNLAAQAKPINDQQRAVITAFSQEL